MKMCLLDYLTNVVTAYALYLIFMPLAGALFPAEWQSFACSLAQQSTTYIRKVSVLTILLGFALFLLMRI
jgi:uncharacterized protein YjeT (DUF2065 family)